MIDHYWHSAGAAAAAATSHNRFNRTIERSRVLRRTRARDEEKEREKKE